MNSIVLILYYLTKLTTDFPKFDTAPPICFSVE
jgi:hypothetical protein